MPASRYSNIVPVQESRPVIPCSCIRRTAKLKPAFLRDIVFGDGNKVGDARFTRQKVVTRGMVLLFFELKGDGEQAPARLSRNAKSISSASANDRSAIFLRSSMRRTARECASGSRSSNSRQSLADSSDAVESSSARNCVARLSINLGMLLEQRSVAMGRPPRGVGR